MRLMTQEDPCNLMFQIIILGVTTKDSENLGRQQYCFLDVKWKGVWVKNATPGCYSWLQLFEPLMMYKTDARN